MVESTTLAEVGYSVARRYSPPSPNFCISSKTHSTTLYVSWRWNEHPERRLGQLWDSFLAWTDLLQRIL